MATSGHELGHCGLRAYLDQESAFGTAWVHLGANLGAVGGRVGVTASDQALALRATHILEEAGGLGPEALRPLDRPVGEAVELDRARLPFVSLVGTNGRFHLPTDRFPDNVDVPRLAGLATSITRLVRNLADEG